MREYRITVTMTEHGRPDVAEGNAEALLTAFEKTHPEVGAAVGADLEQGTLEVTFSIDAEDANEAYKAGRPHIAEMIRRSAYASSAAAELIRLEVEVAA
jgi:hypothetical protein